jgi:hypothetical protein|tara:strand:+ start:134 stop:406 length:273 start_codon:yes stop_codon:yes gene_type:complete
MVLERNIRIIHPTFGELLNDSYDDDTQFKLFLKMVHSCIGLEQDLSFFNGKDFLVHVPYVLLKQSIILGNTKVEELTLGEYAVRKSKMEE